MDKEILSAIKAALAKLNPILDKLPKKGKDAVAALAALLGYGETKGTMDENDKATACVAAMVISEAAGSLLSADDIQLIKDLIAKLEKAIGQKGFAYGYANGKAKESWPLNFSSAVEFQEAIAGSEGLEWKVRLIRAGKSKNSRFYPKEVLQTAVAAGLFEGGQAYEDHPGKDDLPERSVGDLAGWFTNVIYDETQEGVVGQYHALSSARSTSILREMHERNNPTLIGFSINGEGKGSPRVVEGGHCWWIETIDRIRSTDIVTKPAAGGQVLSLLASERYERELKLFESIADSDDEAIPIPVIEATPVQEENTMDMELKTLLESQQVLLDAQDKKLKLFECELGLGRAVDASGLAEPMKARIRKEFGGHIFEAAELEARIEADKVTYAALMDIESRRAPTVRVTEDSQSKVAKGIKGMILEEAQDGIPPFRSIYTAYCAWNGLDILYNAPSRDVIARRVVRESLGFDSGAKELHEAVSFGTVLGDSIHTRLLKEWPTLGYDDWRKIVSSVVSLEDLNPQNPALISSIGTLPIVAPGGPYQDLGTLTDESMEWTPAKRGGSFFWTWEDAMNDRLNVLRRMPGLLAKSAKITVYEFVFSLLTSNPLTYDGVAVFDASHANLSERALSSATLSAAKLAMGSQTVLGSTHEYLASPPRYLICGMAPAETAKELLVAPFFVDPANPDSQRPNPHKSDTDAPLDRIIVPFWTTSTDWYLSGDPSKVPTIEVGFLNGKETPDILAEASNAGTSFFNDEVVWKVRLVFGGGVVDYRSLYAALP